MNGIYIGIDPVAFRLGGIELRWYSLAVMAAVLAAVYIIARRAPKRGIPSS